jgi:Plasma-membrane choline transporter
MGKLNKEVKIVKVIMCITGYLLWILENVIKYISKRAYIQIALTNVNFFKAAWNAFTLIIKNAHRFGFGAAINAIFTLFGIFAISSTITGTSYLFITSESEMLGLTSPIGTTVVIALLSMVISWLFMSIFTFSTDAILQSFLLDEELRFAGNSRPIEMAEFAEAMKKRSSGCLCFRCCCC